MKDSAMLNNTSNITTEGATVIFYGHIADGILFLIVVFLIIVLLMVIAALIATSEIVCTIRWILINLLVADVVAALGSTLYHLSPVDTVFTALSFELNSIQFFQTFLVIMSIGNVGRLYYYNGHLHALTVFIVVRWWNESALAPRNTKYFLIGAVFAWLFVIPPVVPFVVDQEGIGMTFCERSSTCAAMGLLVYTVVFMVHSAFSIFFFECIMPYSTRAQTGPKQHYIHKHLPKTV